MRKTNHIFLAFACLMLTGFFLCGNVEAQKRKKTVKKKQTVNKKKEVPLFKAVVTTGGSSFKSEPYLALEPCAKETTEQITELENAADKNKQLELLVKRIGSGDEWLRACSIYRLGEFRAAAQNALPVIIKLLHDETNHDVWTHVENAMWKIPPDPNVPLAENIEISRGGDVYERLYAIYSLSYFKPIPASFQAKDTLKTLIENATDSDVTVSWLSVIGIRQLAFYGVDTTDAIPVLSDLLKNGKLNPVNVVSAFVPMGENALPAAPLLFDVLYNPKKYAPEKEGKDRSYALFVTTAIALGKIGKPLVPLLEKEAETHPFQTLQVLSNIIADGTLPIFFKAMKHQNPEVRKKAIESLPGLTSIGAVETLPHLLEALNDTNEKVRESAISKIGSIAKYTENKSPELQEMLKKKAIPALTEKLGDKSTSCNAALNLGDFGADAEPAIPALVRLIKKNGNDFCAEKALYEIGIKGRKHLTAEQIKYIEEDKKRDRDIFNNDYNKAKPIKPKEEPKPSPTVTGKDA